MSEHDLESRWRSAIIAVGAGGDVAAPLRRLLAAYGEPHRAYHDLRHLAEVLAAIDVLAPHAAHIDHVRLAAWFHDVVYDVRAGDNEERSATLAERELHALGVPEASVAEVARLVRLTTTHTPSTEDADGQVLCDADLAVLGREEPRYRAYAADVRREYRHVPENAFIAGRSAVLRRFLARESIFSTDHGRAHWESAARRNLNSELGELGGAAGPRPAAG